jgi:excisionase family DNA binding protein
MRTTPTDKLQQDLAADGLASLREAGRFLSVSRTTLYELMNDGALPYCKIRGARRIPWAALKAFAAESIVGSGK